MAREDLHPVEMQSRMGSLSFKIKKSFVEFHLRTMVSLAALQYRNSNCLLFSSRLIDEAH